MSGEVAKRDEQPVALPESTPPIMALLHAAVDKQVPVETLERLMALHERIAERDAAMEFANALARFQAACGPVPKSKKADRYKYAPLNVIADHIGPHLHPNGLSYTWDTDIQETGINITCTLRHINGHSVQSHCFMAVGNPERGLSRAQMTGSAMTYAQRYSLIQVLGLTTCDEDDDGAGAGGAKPKQDARPKRDPEARFKRMMALYRELGISDDDRRASLGRYYSVQSARDLTEGQVEEVIAGLENEQNRRKQEEQGR